MVQLNDKMSQDVESNQSQTQRSAGPICNSEVIHDMVLGFADGLTVPFALTAGLSSLGSSKLVVIGGLAELFSGAISMGLGAYLAVTTSRDQYFYERERKRDAIDRHPDVEREECRSLLENYRISAQTSKLAVGEICADAEDWLRFMMDVELKLERPPRSRAYISAATIAATYFLGGLIPMIPYFALKNVTHALFTSIAITVVMLLSFGFIKDWILMRKRWMAVKGALWTLVVGGAAAAASYGIVKAIDSSNLM